MMINYSLTMEYLIRHRNPFSEFGPATIQRWALMAAPEMETYKPWVSCVPIRTLWRCSPMRKVTLWSELE